MHDNESVNSCCDIVEHDTGPFGQTFQLANRRRLENVECSKKYKTSEESLPRQGNSDEGDELSGDFVDDDKLRVFGAGGARDLGSSRNADQSYEDRESDYDWST